MNESQYFTMREEEKQKERERKGEREKKREGERDCGRWSMKMWSRGKEAAKESVDGRNPSSLPVGKGFEFLLLLCLCVCFPACLPACVCVCVRVGGNNGTWRWKRCDRRACITSTISDFAVLAIYRNSCRTFLISEWVCVCVQYSYRTSAPSQSIAMSFSRHDERLISDDMLWQLTNYRYTFLQYAWDNFRLMPLSW